MTVRIADDFPAINARLEEIQREKEAVRKRQEQAEDATYEYSPYTIPPDLPDYFG